MSSTPLSVEGFRTRTTMPSEDVDLIEQRYPGFLSAQISITTSRIYAQLGKRYDWPFADPAPEIFLGWVTACVTPFAYRKRGWNPASDEQAAQVEQDRTDALAEVQLAADAQDGLYDLPLRQDTSDSGVARGAPFVYSEQSPYDWLDVQAEALRGR